jgi:hypothetical protein
MLIDSTCFIRVIPGTAQKSANLREIVHFAARAKILYTALQGIMRLQLVWSLPAFGRGMTSWTKPRQRFASGYSEADAQRGDET